MATCRNIINRALRKLGRLGGGREPRTADQTDALAALQGLYTAWVASGAFGRMADVTPLTDYTAGENERIIRTDATIAVTLPETVPYYSDPLPYNRERDTYATNYEAVDCNNRPPRNGALVQIKDRAGGKVETWIYDGTARDWVSIENLQLDSEAPRSGTDPEGLSALLATELADTFGAELGPTTLNQAKRYTSGMVSDFSRPRQTAMGVYC